MDDKMPNLRLTSPRAFAVESLLLPALVFFYLAYSAGSGGDRGTAIFCGLIGLVFTICGVSLWAIAPEAKATEENPE